MVLVSDRTVQASGCTDEIRLLVCVRAIKETEILNSNSFIRFSVVPLVLERNPFCVFHLYIYWHLYSLFCLLLSHPWCRWTYNNIRLHNIAMRMAMERMNKKTKPTDTGWNEVQHICRTNVYLTELIRLELFNNMIIDECTCLKAT